VTNRTTREMPDNRKNLVDYCNRFASLNVSSTQKRGKAQYKPILLLSVIDLIAQEIIEENKIFVSDELINTFNRYWNILASEYEGGLHYPFMYLQSEEFWHLEFQPDFKGLQPKTTNKLKQAVQYAKLDDELFKFIKDPNSRQELIDTLIAVWFSSAQKEIEDILPINQDFQASMDEEDEQTESTERKYYLRKSLIRNAFFRKTIVYVYGFRCSFCGLKVIHSTTQSIVDGAHIKPFAKFYDNQIDNGISLCKNHHWAFDQGLFTIDDNYKLIITDDFTEEAPNTKPIKDFQGETLILPNSEEHFPRLEAIQWHRENIFRS
jgi:putative restriction endonuclease